MEGMLFNIQRYSIHDGPGIRTTVFFKGCNLDCFWCHNAESKKPYKQVQYFAQKCTLCARCVIQCAKGLHVVSDGVKTYDRKGCAACGNCVKGCAAGALAMSGYAMDTLEVVKEIEKDAPFYKSSGGGATFSGGEPMLQLDFLESVLKLCKQKGIHTAVDTAGCVAWGSFEKILEYTDLFLYDIKTMDEKKHIRSAGTGNALILGNLKKLAKSGADIIVRVPLIPGFNDTPKDILEIADFVNRLPGIVKAEILPYNEMAGVKFESLGLEPPPKGGMREKTENYEKYFLANNK